MARCNFTETVFTGANLSEANVCDSDFSGADLSFSDLAPLDICESIFLPDPDPRYDCDTIFTGTIFDIVNGGVDPQDPPYHWILLDGPCASLIKIGEINPIDSLVPISPRPKLGEVYTLGLDDPFGSSSLGSSPLLLVSSQPDPAFFDPLTPDGTLMPGLGMGGPVGELLVSLAPVNYVTTIVGHELWSHPGTPAEIDINVPASPFLLGAEFYVQGVLASADTVKLTAAALLIVGN